MEAAEERVDELGLRKLVPEVTQQARLESDDAQGLIRILEAKPPLDERAAVGPLCNV
jgi:hypothetical protein